MPFENYLPQLGQGALDTLPAFGDFSWRNRLAGNPQGFDESLVRSVGGALSFLGLMGIGGGLGLGPLASMGAIGALQEGSARERAVRAATMPLTAMLAGPIAGRLGAAIPEVEAGMGGLQSTLLRGARTAAVEFPGAALGATLQPAVSHAALNAMGEQQPALTRDDALRSFGEQYITGLLTHGLQTPHGEDLRTAGLKQLANLHNTLLPRDPSLLYAAAGGGAGIPREAFPTRRSMLTPGAKPPDEPKLAALTNDIPSDAASLTMARRALIAAHRLRSKIKGQTELPKIPPFLLPGRNPKEAAARDAALTDLIRAHGGTHNLAVAMSRGRWPKTPTEFRASTLEDFDRQLMDYPEGSEQPSTIWERTPPEYPDSEKRQRTDPEYREVPIDPDAPKSIHSRGGVISPEVQADDARYASLGWTRRHGKWVPPAPQPTPFSEHPPGTAAWWAQQTRIDPPSVSQRLAAIAEPTPTGPWFEPTGTTEPAMPINRPTGEDAVTRALEILKNASSPEEGRRLLLDAQQRGELTIKDIADALGRRNMSEGRLGTKMTDTYVNKERDEDGAINKYERPVGMNIEQGNQERYHRTPLTPIDSDISGFHSALNNADTVIDENGNLVKRVSYNGKVTDLTLAEHTDLMQAYKGSSIQTPMKDPSIHPALDRLGLTERHVTTLGHIADAQRVEDIPDPIAERSNDTKASRGYYQQDPTLEREDRWNPLGPAYATYLKLRSLNKPGEYKSGNYTFDEFFTREASRLWGPDPFWRSAPVYAVDENRQVIDGISHFINLTQRYERWPNGDVKMARTGDVPIGAELPKDPSDSTGKRKLSISKVRQENLWQRNKDLYGGTHVMDMEFANAPALNKKGEPIKRPDGSIVRPTRDAIYKALVAGKLVNLDHPLDAYKTNQFRDYILEKVDSPLENLFNKNKKEFYKRANDAYNELIRNGTDPHVAISIIKELRDSGNAIGFLDNMISHNLPARSIIDSINALSPTNNFGSRALTSIKVQVRNDDGVASTEQVIGGYGQNLDYAAPQQLALTKQRLNKWYELDPSGERSTSKNPRHRVTDMPPSGRKYVRIVDPAFRETPPTPPAPEPTKPTEPAPKPIKSTPQDRASSAPLSLNSRRNPDRMERLNTRLARSLDNRPRHERNRTHDRWGRRIDEFGNLRPHPALEGRHASRAVREGRPDLDARMLYPDRPARPIGTYNHTTENPYAGIPDPEKSVVGSRWAGTGAYGTKASHDEVSYGQYKKILEVKPSARFLHLDRPLPKHVRNAILNAYVDWRNGVDVESPDYHPDPHNFPGDPTPDITRDMLELEQNASRTTADLLDQLLAGTKGRKESFGWSDPPKGEPELRSSGLGMNHALQQFGEIQGFPLDIGHIAAKLGYTGQMHVGGTYFGTGPHKVLVYTDKNAVKLVSDTTPESAIPKENDLANSAPRTREGAEAMVEKFHKPIAILNLLSKFQVDNPADLAKIAVSGPGPEVAAIKDAAIRALPEDFLKHFEDEAHPTYMRHHRDPSMSKYDTALNTMITRFGQIYREHYRDYGTPGLDSTVPDAQNPNYDDQTNRLHFVADLDVGRHTILHHDPNVDILTTTVKSMAEHQLAVRVHRFSDLAFRGAKPTADGVEYDRDASARMVGTINDTNATVLQEIDKILAESATSAHHNQIMEQVTGALKWLNINEKTIEQAMYAKAHGLTWNTARGREIITELKQQYSDASYVYGRLREALDFASRPGIDKRFVMGKLVVTDNTNPIPREAVDRIERAFDTASRVYYSGINSLTEALY